MKKLTILLAALICCLALRAQSPAPELTFDHTEYDFGVLGDKGGEVTHEYTFTNSGTAPLLVTRVETSCGCTTAKWDKKPLAPGDTARILIIYNPRKETTKGTFYKAIQVFSNDPRGRLLIVARGEVKKGK